MSAMREGSEKGAQDGTARHFFKAQSSKFVGQRFFQILECAPSAFVCCYVNAIVPMDTTPLHPVQQDLTHSSARPEGI